jgi:WD40 repeat protein
VRLDAERRLRPLRRDKYFVFTRRRLDCSWVWQRKNSSVGHRNFRSKAIVDRALRHVRFFFFNNPIPIFFRILFFCRPWALRFVRFFFFCHQIFFPCRFVSCADSWHCKRSVFSVVYSPDGTKIASGSGDNTVKIWNAQTGQCVSTLSGHTGSVLSVCFDHTGKKLASGGGYGDNSVRLWSTESGTPIGSPLSGHSG